jgi:hypothetical protein
MLRNMAKRLRARLPHVAPDPYYEMPEHYTGAKRERYIRATDDVVQNGMCKQYAGVNAFVKFEKGNPKAKPDADPRMIQFRDPRYCVAVGRWLKPIEHHLYSLTGDGKWWPRTRWVGKGLNQRERAMLLFRKRAAIPGKTVTFGIDVSRFDRGVDVEHLEIEHSIYNKMARSKFFAALLKYQLFNVVRTSRGMRYTLHGGRMSGDMNTGLGNCILAAIMLTAYAFHTLGPQEGNWDILVDGDDALLIVHKKHEATVDATLLPQYAEFGMKCRLENKGEEMEEILWCQCKPVEYAPGLYKFIDHPSRVFSRALGSTKFNTKSVAYRKRLVATIGKGLIAINLGIPVLQAFGEALVRAGGERCLAPDQALTGGVYYKVKYELGDRDIADVTPSPIAPIARQSFEKAHGIAIDEQHRLEEWLGHWEPQLDGDWALPPQFVPKDWTQSIRHGREVWTP